MCNYTHSHIVLRYVLILASTSMYLNLNIWTWIYSVSHDFWYFIGIILNFKTEQRIIIDAYSILFFFLFCVDFSYSLNRFFFSESIFRFLWIDFFFFFCFLFFSPLNRFSSSSSFLNWYSSSFFLRSINLLFLLHYYLCEFKSHWVSRNLSLGLY